MSIQARVVALTLLPLVAVATPAKADPQVLERPLVQGSTLRMKLSAGGYRIRAGSTQDRIRVSWDRTAEVEFTGTGAEARLRVKGPRNNFRVEIEVPARLNLDIDMSVGEVDIAGIQGDKHIDLNIGEVRVQVPDTGAYKHVEAALKIGEIHARPFNVVREGFFRNFEWTGTGTHTLEVRLGIGEVHLVPAEPKP